MKQLINWEVQFLKNYRYKTKQGIEVELSVDDMAIIHQYYLEQLTADYLRENHLEWTEEKVQEIAIETRRQMEKYDYSEQMAIQEAITKYENPQEILSQDIMHEIKEIKEELLRIQEYLLVPDKSVVRDDVIYEINGRKERDTINLEESYIEAMKLAGYQLVETPPESLVMLTFKDMKSEQTIGFDGWEMVGQELEELAPLNEADREYFVALIHPESRVSYYTMNLGGTGVGEDSIPVIYPTFESALNAYLEAEVDGKSMGYVFDAEERPMVSFDVIKMKHKKESADYSDLFQNEISEIKHDSEYLEYVLQRENTYLRIEEGFHDILFNDAMQEMQKMSDLWGSWGGRVANIHRPQDYIDIDITGYKYHDKVICEVLVVHANEIQDAKEMVIYIDRQNLKQSLEDGMKSIAKEYSQFLRDSVDLLATDIEYPMQLYAKNHTHTVEEHFEMLENKGYDTFADREEYFAGRKNEIEAQEESKPPVSQPLRKPKL